MDIQAAVALGIVAALEGRGVLLVIRIHQRVDFAGYGRVGGGNMLLGDEAALVVDEAILRFVGDGKGFRQAVAQGGQRAKKRRKAQDKGEDAAMLAHGDPPVSGYLTLYWLSSSSVWAK